MILFGAFTIPRQNHDLLIVLRDSEDFRQKILSANFVFCNNCVMAVIDNDDDDDDDDDDVDDDDIDYQNDGDGNDDNDFQAFICPFCLSFLERERERDDDDDDDNDDDDDDDDQDNDEDRHGQERG